MKGAATDFPSLVSVLRRLDGWVFGPADTRVCAWLRIGFGILVTINLSLLVADMELWFGEAGAVPYAAGRSAIDPDTVTLFALFPKTGIGLLICGIVMVLNGVLLTVGLGSRFNAACVFLWLVSVQHRNHLLFDGEDIFFRLFAFFLIFLPIGVRWSVDAKLGTRPEPEAAGSAWALRLIQIQLCVIYLSTVLLKLDGEEWLDGSALWYVFRLDDVYGRLPVPEWVTHSAPVLQLAGWLVILVEAWLVIGLWFRETRRFSIVLGFALHLALELMMNLFLFEWLMMLALTSFLHGKEVDAIGRRLRFWNRKPTSE